MGSPTMEWNARGICRVVDVGIVDPPEPAEGPSALVEFWRQLFVAIGKAPAWEAWFLVEVERLEIEQAACVQGVDRSTVVRRLAFVRGVLARTGGQEKKTN